MDLCDVVTPPKWVMFMGKGMPGPSNYQQFLVFFYFCAHFCANLQSFCRLC